MSAGGGTVSVPATDRSGQRGTGELRWLVDQLAVVVAAIFLTVVLRTFVIEPFRIPSESMLPTLRPGDQVFVAKWIFGAPLPLADGRLPAVREPERGEVVIFEMGVSGLEIGPRDVCTPTTFPPCTSMPVSSVFMWMWTPAASAARA